MCDCGQEHNFCQNVTETVGDRFEPVVFWVDGESASDSNEWTTG